MTAEQPNEEMLAAADKLARFIETGRAALLRGLFADPDVTIIENFAPYLFEGPGAAAAWAKAMRGHTRGLTALTHSFAPPYDFGRAGDVAYFSLPTTWRGLSHGKAFTETGGWAFVLVWRGGAWRVRAYGWAVTGFSFDD
ncbi:MAG TPA: hypothetical protein VII63_02730 [Caulobacteraceae bacterium]